ncbi:MAG: HNH endonuclease signature motif containing protein, partial [Acidimicrobiia bacterium]|nr:HNH endonuclease signature motif containing protein [Acidimicrobiia bacterium]
TPDLTEPQPGPITLANRWSHQAGERHGCTADGCTSRYRLQPHHIIPWSQGGRTDPDNLITLCWFHHHVVIHQMGYEIIPDSPPGRLRFQLATGTDPP